MLKKLVCFLAVALILSALPAVAQNPPHSVALSWVASPDAVANPSLTNNVYRLVASCPASVVPSQFTKVNPSPLAVTSFTDTNVTAAATYCYFVTAQLGGLESVPSNTFQAVIPLAPDSGLSGIVK